MPYQKVTIALFVLLVTATACGSSTHSPVTTTVPGSTTSTTHPPRAGTVNLGFAGSMQVVNEQFVGPAFTAATGYSYQGQGSGSAAIAQYIISGQYSSNVFESVGGKPIETLEPKYTSFYIRFAASPLVIAYNPSGPFSSQLAAIRSGKKPVSSLFSVMADSGFKLGRTDPNVDPQGQGFLLMLQLAQSQLGVPASVTQSDLANSQIFAETSLESTLQAGELDAASAYLPQAIQMKLPYIMLPSTIDLGDPADAATYGTASITLTAPAGKIVTASPLTLDITTIAQPGESAADSAAATAFVSYVLSKDGLAVLRKAGYTILPTTLYGNRTSVPSSILSEIAAFEPAGSKATP